MADTTDQELYSTLPLEAYKIGPGPRMQRVRLAEDRLVAACLKRRGIPWHPPPISPNDANPEFRRYGVTRPEVAREFGYREAIDPLRERRNHFFLDGLTWRQRAALTGTRGRPGCQHEAQVGLRRDTAEVATVVTRLGRRSLDQSERLATVQRVKAQWSACMRSAGYIYPEPAAAANDPKWHLDHTRPSDQEVRVAMADVGCKRRVRLPEVWSGAEAGVQRRLIARESATLARVRRANTALLANTKRVLAGQPLGSE